MNNIFDDEPQPCPCLSASKVKTELEVYLCAFRILNFFTNKICRFFQKKLYWTPIISNCPKLLNHDEKRNKKNDIKSDKTALHPDGSMTTKKSRWKFSSFELFRLFSHMSKIPKFFRISTFFNAF